MKNIQNKLTALLFIAITMTLSFTYISSNSPQSSLKNNSELKFEVNTIYPPLSIKKETLKSAKSLVDLNQHYKSSWVKEYVSVEVLTSYKGKIKKAVSQNDILSQAQKSIMKKADVGSDISVKVKYLPKNTLTNNDVKEINFSFKINPDIEATYKGGEQQLKKYLKETAINKINDDSFDTKNLAAVKFAINEKGQVIDAHIFETSKNEQVDKLLLEAISKMPNWKPAEYANNLKVKQEFVLTVGNHESCVMNLLGINK